MLFDRNLIICAALIALSTSLLFIYFNRKTKEIDDKMTSLFQLIQDYATGDDDDNESTDGYINVQEKTDMIQVSDGEDDYEVDDVDDDLEQDELNESENIMETNKDNLENNENEHQQINLFKSTDDTDSLEAVDIDMDEFDEQTKQIEVKEEVDLSKLKVTELKQLCSNKGLTGYSGLKKEELVNLLSS